MGIPVSNPIDRFLMACPADFFRRRLMEYFDAAFGEAYVYVNRHIEEPERANMLGQPPRELRGSIPGRCKR